MDGWSELVEGNDDNVAKVDTDVDSTKEVIVNTTIGDETVEETIEKEKEVIHDVEDELPEKTPDQITVRKRITSKIDRKNAPVKRLLYGGASAGKTRSALNFFHQKWIKNNNAKCWYVDTERGLKQTLKEFPDELDKSIECFECDNFKNILGALDLTISNAQKGDVIIVDMLSVLWEWAQSDYTKQVFGDDMSEFYITRRKELIDKGGKAGVFDGWKDWVGIKLIHNQDFIDILVRQTGADLICICGAKEVEMNDTDKGKMVKNPTIFTPIGFAPEGEKHNEHRFDSIFYMWAGETCWYMRAPKFRGNYDKLRKKVKIDVNEFPEI